jgi:hypothetical protein
MSEWRQRCCEGILKHERGSLLDNDKGDKRLIGCKDGGFENWYSIVDG